MKQEIQLGNTVRDIVSGLTGIATSRVEYLNGCVQYSVKPKAEKPNECPDGFYIDAQQLEKVDDGITVVKKETGGPTSDAPKRFGLSSI